MNDEQCKEQMRTFLDTLVADAFLSFTDGELAGYLAAAVHMPLDTGMHCSHLTHEKTIQLCREVVREFRNPGVHVR